jgi:hypothetical protein
VVGNAEGAPNPCPSWPERQPAPHRQTNGLSNEMRSRQLGRVAHWPPVNSGVQTHVLGKLVRVDGLWGCVTQVATVEGSGGRTAAVVLDGDVERSVIIREDVLGLVDLELGGEAVELYVMQEKRSVVFEVAPW